MHFQLLEDFCSPGQTWTNVVRRLDWLRQADAEHGLGVSFAENRASWDGGSFGALRSPDAGGEAATQIRLAKGHELFSAFGPLMFCLCLDDQGPNSHPDKCTIVTALNAPGMGIAQILERLCPYHDASGPLLETRVCDSESATLGPPLMSGATLKLNLSEDGALAPAFRCELSFEFDNFAPLGQLFCLLEWLSNPRERQDRRKEVIRRWPPQWGADDEDTWIRWALCEKALVVWKGKTPDQRPLDQSFGALLTEGDSMHDPSAHPLGSLNAWLPPLPKLGEVQEDAGNQILTFPFAD